MGSLRAPRRESADVDLHVALFEPYGVRLELAPARVQPLAGLRVERPLVKRADHPRAVEARVLERHVLVGAPAAIGLDLTVAGPHQKDALAVHAEQADLA